MNKLVIVLTLILISLGKCFCQDTKSEVLLEGFWWDFTNANYPNRWADYLTDLAPRLRKLGINKVWVPPASKNVNLKHRTGYELFDHYDLGDKFQKNALSTSLGTKDEYLRMIAVMHANGIDVVQDVIFNHVIGAGSANGEGGQDYEFDFLSEQSNDGYKAFRYSCYKTPAIDESEGDYLSREGRWPKNWMNFRPNKHCSFDQHSLLRSADFGPDFAYESPLSYGKLGPILENATVNFPGRKLFNPDQYENYNLIEAKKWLIWMKKQTGIDGLRWDATELFDDFVSADLCQSIRSDAGWASGGPEMFNVGECSSVDADRWVGKVNEGRGDMMGAFDFSLRFELSKMVKGKGSYDLGSIPDKQVKLKSRTVPFVNNHDTFRPNRKFNGDYGDQWNSEVTAWTEIRPTDPRFSLAYALIFALDGTPQIFFEDLFDIGYTGTGIIHFPSDESKLPTRPSIANLIWCHNKLNFKSGTFHIRAKQQDVLVIERSKKAIIAMNDASKVQEVEILTDFIPGTQLQEYSLQKINPKSDLIVGAGGKIKIKIPAVSTSANNSGLQASCHEGGGYVIIGPEGIEGGFELEGKETTQEWEMSDDLGDSHPKSLGQGGSLPGNSTKPRIVGNIFSDAGKEINVKVSPEMENHYITTKIYDPAGNVIANETNKGIHEFKILANSVGYYNIQISNTENVSPKQNVSVMVRYIAPKEINSKEYAPIRYASSNDRGELIEEKDQINADVFPNPFYREVSFSLLLKQSGNVKIYIYDIDGREILLSESYHDTGIYKSKFNFETLVLEKGFYIYKIIYADGIKSGKLIYY